MLTLHFVACSSAQSLDTFQSQLLTWNDSFVLRDKNTTGVVLIVLYFRRSFMICGLNMLLNLLKRSVETLK